MPQLTTSRALARFRNRIETRPPRDTVFTSQSMTLGSANCDLCQCTCFAEHDTLRIVLEGATRGKHAASCPSHRHTFPFRVLSLSATYKTNSAGFPDVQCPPDHTEAGHPQSRPPPPSPQHHPPETWPLHHLLHQSPAGSAYPIPFRAQVGDEFSKP